jgi:universal stress protein E
MRRVDTILCAIKDPHRAPRATLRKAAALARASGARVELFHAIADPVLTDVPRHARGGVSRSDAMREILTERESRLQRMGRLAILHGVRSSVRVEWDFPAHEAIVRRAMASKAALVVLESPRHLPGANLLLTHSDWELIRTCPCPLLLARSPREYRRPIVLAAVDPRHAHDKPAKLDRVILATATAVAKHLHGETHVAHAYLPPTAFVPTVPGDPLAAAWIPPSVFEAHRKQLAIALGRIARAARIPAARQHLVVGEPVRELPSFARRLRAQIVVMGAVSRSGLKRLFVGHTAQQALRHMRCDVLIVKPKGFKAPVPRQSRNVGPVIGFTVY